MNRMVSEVKRSLGDAERGSNLRLGGKRGVPTKTKEVEKPEREEDAVARSGKDGRPAPKKKGRRRAKGFPFLAEFPPRESTLKTY